MKKLLILLCVVIFSTVSFAQHTFHGEEHKCSGRHHFHSQNKSSEPDYEQSDEMFDYDVKFYWLDIEVDNTSTFIEGNVTVQAVVQNNPLEKFVIELKDYMVVDHVLFAGTQLNFTHSNDEIHVDLPSTLAIGESFEAQIFYSGTAQNGLFNEQSSSWGNDVTFSLSESFKARDWWPSKQVLADKADSAYIYITTPDNLKAGSNGLLTASITMPDNKIRYEWKTNYPINYYLISISVAEYVEYNIYANPTGAAGPVLIQNYVYNASGCLPYFQEEIDKTVDLLELFSSLFGLYPFHEEKYGHCMAPLNGGMEHQTMTTLGYFEFWLIAHEIGHQWFGDNVTCATWQDIWINEGFASYSDYLSREYLVSQNVADSWMANAHDYVMSQPGGHVYIPEQHAFDEGMIFDYRISYQKGPAIIHTLRYIINDDDLFFQLLTDFQNQYTDDVATGADFRDLATELTGIDFTPFFDQWYYGEGFPTYSIQYEADGNTLRFTTLQTTSTNTTPFFSTPIEYKINYAGGNTTVRFEQHHNVQTYEVELPGSFTSIEIDPNNYVLNQDGTISGCELPDVTLSEFNDMLITDSELTLTGGSPIGGEYFGVGVNGGVFDPAIAGEGTHAITYTYSEGNCTATATQFITVNLVTNITGFNFEDLVNLYPNPTTGIFVLEIENTDFEDINIQICDLSGRQVYEQRFSNASDNFHNKINLSSFQNGIYMIKVYNEKVSLVKRIVLAQ